MTGSSRLVGGILLTGGSSRRMRKDKATLVVGGEPMAERVARLLACVVSFAVEVGPGYTHLASVRENPPGSGPLAGVAAGRSALLAAGFDGPALVVACDLPLLTADLLTHLASRPGTSSVLPVVGGRAQPLCARWSAEDLAASAAALARGERSLRELPRRNAAELLNEASLATVASPEALFDVDKPEDLAELGCRLESGPGQANHDGEPCLRDPTTSDWIEVRSSRLPSEKAMRWAILPSCGAVVSFTGTVRDHSPGRPRVTGLEYEAHLELAVARLHLVVTAARERWPALGRIALLHRTGPLAVTEATVVVAVSAPHRDEAFAAARFCIDTLKETVPIWKRETWEGGSDWSACDHEIVDVPTHRLKQQAR